MGPFRGQPSAGAGREIRKRGMRTLTGEFRPVCHLREATAGRLTILHNPDYAQYATICGAFGVRARARRAGRRGRRSDHP